MPVAKSELSMVVEKRPKKKDFDAVKSITPTERPQTLIKSLVLGETDPQPREADPKPRAKTFKVKMQKSGSGSGEWKPKLNIGKIVKKLE